MARKQPAAQSRASSRSASTSARSSSAPAARPASAPVPAPKPAAASAAMASQPAQGFLARVAETATGVAVGHVLGRALSGAASMVMGNGSSVPAEEPFKSIEASCQPQLAQLFACMDRNKEGDSSSCQFYMDLLSQCRSGPAESSTASF
ncbi:Coiled-coil-helix-coiled-coil-helix domain-containing protein 2 [Mitosporidium daphniae]|uniref:CHCH domain-containing protein n=1 Tax=Mitosporidium daphniae TaxID=1485682 RepID=A0A098VN32_9MICR|nr:uncharacterized protein DI09_69p60 [Mitosporidium daphniae]KGG50482.1 hypothetical protein DI09_69p60 [Mitosporidium daphniae]|eukprot:XP_013236925.1 uncharacterized protein DI09_69p60 [Mitosporidium daphniae]